MSEGTKALDVSLRVKQLIKEVDLSESDQALAERCLRQLEEPLRLTVFGTDAKHAISLVNLMVGQSLVSPSIPHARILLGHDKVAHARLHFGDGTQKRVDEADFPSMFDDNPSKVRIFADLPVLKKLSILVAVDSDPETLCMDYDKALLAADIALWAGAVFSKPMERVWQSLPDKLRDHSYLVLSPRMDIASWKGIQEEFGEVLLVDPRRAQEAKKGRNGVDKAAFKDAGGTQIVRTIKKEIDAFMQSALDAGEVLLMRYADQFDTVEEPLVREATAAFETTRKLTLVRSDDDAVGATSSIIKKPPGRVNSMSLREKIQSEPQVLKNMPRTQSRPNSKPAPKLRTRSRRSRPPATPWSLDL
ncbi:hypothetical protein N9C96_00660 [bacterium]|nr:hypothetical protein [bacterium]